MKSVKNNGLLPKLVLWVVMVSILIWANVAKAGDNFERLLAAVLHELPSDNGKKTHSPYFFVLDSNDETDQLPLKSSIASVDITGVIANVQLEQVYTNRGITTLEAIYVFPASTRAAIHSMRIHVDDRVIEAVIQEKGKARKTYDTAKQDGKTAALLEQDRPNVFQMNVANIMPGDELRVLLEYTEMIEPEDNIYEFVLPQVVGPRYTNLLTFDETWTENPFLHEGEPQPFEVDFDVLLTSPLPIASVRSSSHEVELEYQDLNTVLVSPTDQDEIGTKDFVLKYKLAGKEIQTGLLYEGEEENFFSLMLAPPDRVSAKETVPREYIFILDVSGSMDGFPLNTARDLIEKTLGGLTRQDSFNILAFAGASDVLSKSSLKATDANIRRALRWLNRTRSGGGTELLPALERALDLPKDTGKSRIVVVATDGYVSVEKEAFALVRSNIGDANLFAFGIGSSVNRHLVEGLATAGDGEPVIVLHPSEASKKATAFLDHVRSPVLQGIRVSFDGLDAYDLEPVRVNDLFAKRPIVVLGKYRGKSSGTVTVTGHNADGLYEKNMELSLGTFDEENSALPYLWARRKIARLADVSTIDPGADTQSEVTDLGLKYHLMTEFTSFVAVDKRVRAKGTTKKTVKQPVALPHNVSDLAVGSDPQNALGALMGAQIGNSFGYGGLGMSGSGTGKGRGSGTLKRRIPKAPCIRAGAAMVKGSISKDVIRRIIRRRLNEAEYCYEQQLLLDPELSGRIAVKFIILADGTVAKALIASSTVNNEVFEKCLISMFERMVFPVPQGGGIVLVTYPLVFTPSKDEQ